MIHKRLISSADLSPELQNYLCNPLYTSTYQTLPHLAHIENDGVFMAVHLTDTAVCWRELVLLWRLRRSACSTSLTSSWGTTVGKLWPLRHFYLDVSQHFSVNLFGSEHIIAQTCSSSSVWYFNEWSYYLQVTQSRGLGLALCFPPLPIPIPADANAIYFLRSTHLHYHYHFPRPEHIISHFFLSYYKYFLSSLPDFSLALFNLFSTLQPQLSF